MGEKIKKAIGVKGDFKTAILPMINYSYTNMYLGGSGYIISMYLTIFLTDVVNLSLKQAGLVVKVENPGIPYGLDCQIGTALYDADGRLLDTKFVAADSSENYTFSFAANDKVAKVKLFGELKAR